MKKKTSSAKKITRFIDKHIVIPITRVVLKISGLFDKSSHKLEALLAKQTTLLFLSLALSLILFIIVDQKKLVFNDKSAEVFKDQAVEVSYNEERFVLEGVPETADITLIGSKANLYIAKQAISNHNVTIDLNDIKEPGTYEVDLNYNNSKATSIETSINPSKATITVYLKESENRKLSYNVVNTDKLDSTLEVRDVSLNLNQVVISGAGYKLKEVATVEALLDVSKLIPNKDDKKTIEAGKYELDNEDISLVAYDSNGNVVDVEINLPEKITASLTITTSSRNVPLNFVIKEGTSLPFGKAISAVTFSKYSVVAYGSDEVLDKLEQNGIDIAFDASVLSRDYAGTVEIPMPTGVNKLDTNSISVKISVTNSVSLSKYNMTLRINALNVPNGYIAGASSSNDAEVLVKPTCAENICRNLSSADIEAYVDLSSLTGKGAGIYKVPVLIRAKTSNARLATYIASPDTVSIELTKK